jgi:hypothetical protein
MHDSVYRMRAEVLVGHGDVALILTLRLVYHHGSDRNVDTRSGTISGVV